MGRAVRAAAVTATFALAVIVTGQAAFFAVLALLLFINRARAKRRARRAAFAAAYVADPLRRWLLGVGPVTAVVEALRQLPPRGALEEVAAATPRVAHEQLAELARALRGEHWVRVVLAQASSRRWWRRLEAARLLAVVARSTDRALLRTLLSDPHPAVQAAVTACLRRLGDAELVAFVLDNIERRSRVVRGFQLGVLREVPMYTAPALLERLRAEAAVPSLALWITLAESLGDSRCLAAVAGLHQHPVAQVRISAARALGRYFDPDGEAVLRHLIADVDWRVRAQAARALGAVGAVEAVPALTRALEDPSWWVRFRAALALVQLGAPGRRALHAACQLPDRYAAEMAVMVSGLPDGSVAELAEA